MAPTVTYGYQRIRNKQERSNRATVCFSFKNSSLKICGTKTNRSVLAAIFTYKGERLRLAGGGLSRQKADSQTDIRPRGYYPLPLLGVPVFTLGCCCS